MKRICYLIFVALFLFFSKNVLGQRGKNGAKVITSTNTIVNEYTTLTANATAGSSAITVASNTLNANNRFGAGNILAAGDLIFIVQMQGAEISGGQWWAGYGYISNYFNAGLYEFAEVISVQGSNTINLLCGLTNNYTSAGKVQIVRVPRYTTLTINSGAELTCDTWDGNKGGVLIIETLNNIDINGAINASGKGFRGGSVSPSANQVDVGSYCTTDSTAGAKKGEGIGANGLSDGIYGRGAPANGGGGGNAHNGGGGGGSNTSLFFAWNGAGFPDTSTSATYIQAWDLETTSTVPTGVPFHKNASYGGGRGGYTFSSADVDALTIGPVNSSWGGDWRRVNGGLGGWPLNANENGQSRLFFGGGGGAGSQNDGWGGAGGNGGGIIYLMSYSTVSGTGTITSNGNNGVNSFGTPTLSKPHAGVDGSGGGGGGGAIVINASAAISNISASTNGGSGGSQIKTKYFITAANMEAEGPGGGGGGGYIAISNGTISRTSNGGANGTSTAVSPENIGVTEFPPNGATKGGPGVNNAAVTNYNITASNVIACQGQPVTLTASIIGTLPPGSSYAWYSSEFGSTTLSNSLTLNIPNPQTTSTYYFGVCPGTFRLAVTLTVSAFSPEAGTNQSICNGSSVNLNATGGTTYSWLPASGLSNTSIPNPVCTVGTTTLYTVHITNADGCQANDTVRVTVNSSANATITPHSAMCVNSIPVTLSAAQNGGVWSGSGITNPVTGTFNPASAGIGNVQITYTISGTCSDSDTTHILVNAAPVINLGHDTTFCQGGTLFLNAGNTGSTYSWIPGGSSSQTLNVSSSGQYIVQVTNAASCSNRDTINVTVNTSSNATITPHLPVCVNSSPISLTAAQTGGIWSGPGITNPSTGAFNPSTAGVGNIQIIYTISGSCGDADTTHILVNALPVVNLGHDTTFCQGGTLILNASNPGSTYAWTPGGSTSQTINVSASGQYIVQVTNAAACSKRDTINVTVNTSSNATITPHLPVCVNSSSINLTAAQTGGLWSGPGITNPATGAFNPSTAGVGNIQIIYTISGTCGDSDTTHIMVNALPIVNLGHDTTLCPGNSILLNAGNPGSTYAWTPGGASSQTLNVSTAGQYIVQVTNAATCWKRDTINVLFNTNANATITPHTPLCLNASPVNLSAAQTGGIWSGPGITNPSNGSFNPALAGPGNIQIIYTISGMCGDSDTTHIMVNALPVVYLGHDTTLCQGNSILLNAGNPGSTYLWTPGGATSQTINVSTSGQYIVQVTNAATCSKRDTINVNFTPMANPTIIPHNPMCVNETPIILAAVQTGGIWSGPGITNPTTGAFNPAVAGSGNIQIIYTITGACGADDTTHIIVNPLPVVNLGNDTTLCQGSTLLLNAGNPGSTYLWTNSMTNQTLTVSSGGIYWVEVTNTNLCSKRDSIIVNVVPVANATINHINPVCSNISPFNLVAAQTGGIWSGNGISSNTNGTFDPSLVGTGNTIITYTIAGTCGNMDTVQIMVLPSPLVSTDTVNPGCPDFNNGAIILQTSGGTIPYTYTWSNGESGNSLINLTNGVYTVTVTDLNNCKELRTVQFEIPMIDCVAPVIYVPNIFSPNGDGQNDNLYVRGQGIKSLEFVIFDRWGEKIFETTEQSIFWDGKFKGKDMPVGVYAYLLKATMNDEQKIDKKGNISLVR